MTMQQELKSLVTNYIQENLEGNDPVFKLETMQNALNIATIDQLWSMYKLVLRNEKFKIVSHNKEYIGISFAGMYCGIERDGYMHS